jgi:ribosomal protein S9
MVRTADLAAADEIMVSTHPKRRIEKMKLMRILAVVLLIGYSGAMLGCGGGGAEVKQQTTMTTLGKELQDLDDAYKKGLLSESEYKDARKKLMKKYDD